MIYVYYLNITIQREQSTWLSWAPFIWGLTLEGDYTGLLDSGYTTDDIEGDNVDNMVGLEVDSLVYTEVSTDTELITTPATFRYIAEPVRQLKVHFSAHKNPWEFSSIRINNAFNVVKSPLSPLQFDGIINNTAYDFRLKNAPSVNDEIDDVFFSQLKTFSTKISIDNADGELNTWAIDNSIYGNLAALYAWEGENIADFNPNNSVLQWTGYVGKTLTGRNLIVSIDDPRKRLDISSPLRVLSLTNWTDATTPISIPEVWGRCTRIPLPCIDREQSSPTTFTFMVADEEYYTVNEVRSVYIARDLYTASPTTGTSGDNILYVTIPASVFSDGSGGYINLDSVSATVWGYEDPDTDVLIQNPLDIIRVKIKQFYDQDFTSDYFDLTNWTTALAKAYDVNYYIDSPIQFRNQIERLAGATLGRFKISVALKYQFFIFDSTDASVTTLYKWQYLPERYFPNILRDPERSLAQVRVSYNRDWSKNEDSESAFGWYLNQDNLVSVFQLTGSQRSKDFKTLVHLESDAILYSQEINSVFGLVFETFSLTVKSTYAAAIVSGDFIDVELDLPEKTLLGFKKCQVLARIPNTDDNETRLNLRIVGDAT